jgi:hypothetical protein
MGITIGSDSPVIISAAGGRESGQAFGWTLTEDQLLTGANPTGRTAVDGDFGTYTPTNGAPIVVRYKAACPVAAGAGGVPRPVWMIPEAYAGNPVVVSWLTGSESGTLATTLAAQGWTTATAGTGSTIALNSGYVRCTAPVHTSATSAQVNSASWLGSQRFYLQGLIRGSSSGASAFTGFHQTGSNDIQYSFARDFSTGFFRHLTVPGGSWSAVDSVNSLPGGGQTISSTTPWLIQSIGRTLTENAETRIDGELYGSMRRNLDSATTASAMVLSLFTAGGASTSAIFEAKNLTILTY